HLVDVCWQAAQFFRFYVPDWPLDDGSCSPRILAYAALLHDFGKVHADFQRALRIPGARFGNRHEILSLAFLSSLEIPESERPWLAAAIAAHHRGLYELFGPCGKFHETDTFALPYSAAYHLAGGISAEYLLTLRDLLRNAPEIFTLCGWPAFESYPFTDSRVAVLDALANESRAIQHFLRRFELPRMRRPGPQPERDWRPIKAAIHTRGLLIDADHLASFGAHPISAALSGTDEVKRGLPDIQSYASFQEEIASLRGSAILEAPTGSGKTEAALLWAGAQSGPGSRTGRILFMLPYQASMNAMQKRLIDRFFPSVKDNVAQWNDHVALAHGRSARKIYEQVLNQNYNQIEAARIAKSRDQIARLHAAPILVSSPFTLIRLLLAARGAEGLWAATAGARLILDEIHAYDPQVTAMILACVAFLTTRLD